jgi:hypothetical protein
VYVELEQSLQSYQRQYYSVLDMIADIGGFAFILFGFAWLLISIVKHHSVKHFLVSSLYSARNPDDVILGSFAVAELLSPPKYSNISGFIIDNFLPHCCSDCIKSRLDWKKRALKEA